MLRVLVFAALLLGCSNVNHPEWFAAQGANLTECGPATAANAVNWAGGNANRHALRKMFPSPSWWRMHNLYSAVSRSGVRVQYKDIRDVKAIDDPNIAGMFFVNRNHFIFVDKVGNGYVSYNPLGPVSEVSLKKITGSSWQYYIAVWKKNGRK